MQNESKYIDKEKAINEIIDVYENNYPTASGDFDEFCGEILRILRNQQGIKQVEWISCEDKLPTVKGRYIVCRKICGRAIVFGAVWYKNKWVSVGNLNKELDYITDWMCFPDPPQTANNSK